MFLSDPPHGGSLAVTAPDILTAHQVAELLRAERGIGISPKRLWQLQRLGVFEPGTVLIRLGRLRRWRRDGLLDWIDRGGADVPPRVSA